MNASKQKHFSKALAASFPHTLPVLTGFGVLGIAYGLLMQTKGYSAFWATLMSAIAYCGSMQFAAISLLTAAFDPLQAFLLSVMVNARHLFHGISMLEKYRGLGKLRPFLIYTLCDETFSIAYTTQPPEDVDRGYFYAAISLLNYLYWVLATLIGGIMGSLITFNTEGLDFVLTALYVVLFLEQVKQRENHLPGIIGILGSVVGLLCFGAANMVVPSMVIILIVLLLGRKKLCI